MKIYAGIDGGGTGTTLELRNENGDVLGRERFGAFNLNSIGQERFRQLLKEVFGTINNAGKCSSLCIGAAGASNPAVQRIAEEEAREAGLGEKLWLHGDHEIALYGATGGRPGCILIAGTGSICTGMDETGKIIRAGGWGHLIGDEGSGYALGRDALSATAQAMDGRRKRTLLTEMILQKLEVSDMGGVIAYVYKDGDKSRIAALSPLVEQAGRSGDEVALHIIRENGKALAELVLAVYQQINRTELSLSLMGGLLVQKTLLREQVIKEIKEKIPGVYLQEPKMDAAGGAALWAMQH